MARTPVVIFTIPHPLDNLLAMKTPQNLLDVVDQYMNHLKMTHAHQQGVMLMRELDYMLKNSLLPGLGFTPLSRENGQTRQERPTSRDFMQTQALTCLLEARMAQQRGFELVLRSQKTQDNHRRSLEHFLAWCNQHSWWPGTPPLNYAPDAREFCSPSLRSGHKVKQQKLTHRSKRYSSYRLKLREISANLRVELDQFEHFLVSPEHPYRKTDAVKEETTRQNYIKEILLMLGWFHRVQGMPLEQLCFNLLIPHRSKKDWKFLSPLESREFWQPYKKALGIWLTQYFKFLQETMESMSPCTKNSKLSALARLGEFQYRKDTTFASDYEQIPILRVIANRSQKVSRKISQKQRNREFIADQDLKWPNVIPGQTALTTIHQQVLDPLRLDCRPKSSANKLRLGSGIARSEQTFFAWFLLAGMPTRRQREHCNLKLALCCPIQRPPDVPTDGVYHPLPPQGLRDQRADGTVKDLYLCKVYSYQGRHYKEGIWVIDARDAKTWNIYGAQSMVIKNRLFRDGTRLYDYIEHYLYGWWLPGGRNQQQIYDWWQADLRGRRGRWVGHGRASFEPCNACYIDRESETSFWCWGYFFIRPQIGLPYNGSEFAAMLKRAARRKTGKLITPHLMRSVWATWAYQVRIYRDGALQIGLTNQEKESLAYAMGMSPKTLKSIYERCSPDEKRRPIEEVIDTKLLKEMVTQPTNSASNEPLGARLSHLTESQRRQLQAIMLQKRQQLS